MDFIWFLKRKQKDFLIFALICVASVNFFFIFDIIIMTISNSRHAWNYMWHNKNCSTLFFITAFITIQTWKHKMIFIVFCINVYITRQAYNYVLHNKKVVCSLYHCLFHQINMNTCLAEEDFYCTICHWFRRWAQQKIWKILVGLMWEIICFY